MNPNNIITLTTDFGTTDIFVGVMKGVILSINPDAKIIDITHDIEPQDIYAGAFLLNSAYSYFPPGTIHVGVIDPGVGSVRRAIAVATEQYYFVAPDNGLLSYVLCKEIVKSAVNLTNPKYFLPQVSNTFHGRDIFAPVAAHISRGVSLNLLGEQITNIAQIPISIPDASETEIIGQIIYIDRFGNLITNVSHELFESARKKRNFIIFVKDRQMRRICLAYAEVSAGELLGIFSSFGNLEIAINAGNAAEILKVKRGDAIKIRFQGVIK
ncbi:SAM-dependent chlorinase/fluorinase [Candidatus Poribacteria bacterium]|nr:SAM-dependent chlorinase/fluorinase [Candidatus Poribacteria bacterium]